MKKDAELTAINETLEEVTTTQESIKGEISVLADSKRHLGTEKRISIFELYTKLQGKLNAVQGYGFDLGRVHPETMDALQRFNDYQSALGRFLLLNTPTQECLNQIEFTFNAILAYRQTVFQHTISNEPFRHLTTFNHQQYLNSLSAIHANGTQTVNPLLAATRTHLQMMLVE